MTKPFVCVRGPHWSVRSRPDANSVKSKSRYSDLARRITDAWLSNVGKQVTADVICGSVEDMLRINMVLAIIEMTGNKPQDWHLRFVRSYRIPTTLFDAEAMQGPRLLSRFSDWASVEHHVVAPYRTAVALGRPEFGRFNESIHNIRIICDRLILPDPSGSERWCVCFSEVHSISDVGMPTRFDEIDLSILQLSREGLSAGDVGRTLNLSARTIEHRIAKMKTRTGVNSFVRLLAITS